MPRLQVVVSIDGLQPEHDVRRAPATYARILDHIEGQHVTVHCTLTRQQARPGYVTAFTEFWAANPNVKRIWFSMYSPQVGERSPEMLTPEDRRLLVDEMGALYVRHPKLMDMRPVVTRGFLQPPQSPEECIFSRTTTCLSANLEALVTPCQYGGTPDCTQCGCMASVGLAALGDYRLGGLIPLRTMFTASFTAGTAVRRLRGRSHATGGGA